MSEPQNHDEWVNDYSDEYNQDTDGEAGFASGEVIVLDVDNAPAFASNDESEHITVVQVDPNTGQEVIETIDLSLPPLTVEQSKDITERIRTTTNVLYLLIKRAHAGKAHKALGYDNFEAYVNAEFNMSRSYAYKLLNQANIIAAIEEKAPEGTQIHVGDATARSLKKVLPELLSEVEEKTAGLSADEAGDVIEDVINNMREQKRQADEDALDDEDGDEPRQFDGPYTGEYNGASYDDDDDEDDDEVDEFLDGDPGEARRKFDKLYNLYSGLKTISIVDDPSELLDFIPTDRKEEIRGLLDTAIPLLNAFNEQWNAYEAANPTTSDDESFAEDDSDE